MQYYIEFICSLCKYNDRIFVNDDKAFIIELSLDQILFS